MRARRRLALFLCAASLLTAACAARTAIVDVRARADELQGRQVTIAGTVVETLAVPLVGSRYYELDDGSGQMWVETRAELPAEGERVRATGTLSPGLEVGSVKLGLVLVERRRR